jgi:hypothetical protein
MTPHPQHEKTSTFHNEEEHTRGFLTGPKGLLLVVQLRSRKSPLPHYLIYRSSLNRTCHISTASLRGRDYGSLKGRGPRYAAHGY